MRREVLRSDHDVDVVPEAVNILRCCLGERGSRIALETLFAIGTEAVAEEHSFLCQRFIVDFASDPCFKLSMQKLPILSKLV